MPASCTVKMYKLLIFISVCAVCRGTDPSKDFGLNRDAVNPEADPEFLREPKIVPETDSKQDAKEPESDLELVLETASNQDATNPESDPEFIREPKIMIDRLIETENQLLKQLEAVASSTASLDTVTDGLLDYNAAPILITTETPGGALGEVEQIRGMLSSLKTRFDDFLTGHDKTEGTHKTVENVGVQNETTVHQNEGLSKLEADVMHLVGVTNQQAQEIKWLREELSRMKEIMPTDGVSKGTDENDLKTIQWLQTTVRELRSEMTELYTAVNATTSLQRQVHLETRIDVMDRELTRLRHLLTGVIVHKEGEKSEISELYASVHRLEAMQTSVSGKIEDLGRKYAIFEEAHLMPTRNAQDEETQTEIGSAAEVPSTMTGAIPNQPSHHHRHNFHHHYLIDLHKTVDTLNEKLVSMEARTENLTNAFEASVLQLGSLSSAFTDIQESFAEDLASLRFTLAGLSTNVTHVNSAVTELVEASVKLTISEEDGSESATDENPTTKQEKGSKKKKGHKERSKEHKDKDKSKKNKQKHSEEDEEKNKSEEED